MKIAICGSMNFAREMLGAKGQLERAGHVVFIPENVDIYAQGLVAKVGGSEGARRKIAEDLIRRHYDLICKSDAILVLNYDKRGVQNYIGGNTFLEMGFAYILNKQIFLLNEIPETEMIKQEIEAMQPIVLYGNLNKIPADILAVK